MSKKQPQQVLTDSGVSTSADISNGGQKGKKKQAYKNSKNGKK